MILAAEALGETAGAIVFSRFLAPPTRLRVMGPLAVAACGVLVLFFLRPGLPVSLLILFASGLCAGYQIAANAAFVSAAPQEQRSQAFGLAQGGMSLGQGVVMILAGAVADHYSPAWVIAVCGAVGAVVALAIALSWARDRRPAANGHRQRIYRVRSSGRRAWRCSFSGRAGSGVRVALRSSWSPRIGMLLPSGGVGWRVSVQLQLVAAHGVLLLLGQGGWLDGGQLQLVSRMRVLLSLSGQVDSLGN